MIALAESIARKAHAGQFRRDGVTPYITHPEAVAAAVSDAAKPVAWLHDVLEDTETTAFDLRKAGVAEPVVQAVLALTKLADEPYLRYVLRIAKNPLAREVKVADIRHNLSGSPTAKARKRYAEALRILEAAQ